MNTNSLIYYDFETCSKNPHKTQPIQLSAVAINGRTLEVIPESEFNSMIYAYDGEEAKSRGFDEISDEALKVNGKTREEIFAAPKIEEVGPAFEEYCKRYSTGSGKWNLPIRAGYNINNFDDIILNRMATEWKVISCDKEYQCQNVTHPLHNCDLMKLMWFITENQYVKGKNSISFGNIADWMGLETSGLHDALQDCKYGAAVLSLVLKVGRKSIQKVEFENIFKKYKNQITNSWD